jgi:hypothetical protein
MKQCFGFYGVQIVSRKRASERTDGMIAPASWNAGGAAIFLSESRVSSPNELAGPRRMGRFLEEKSY